MSTRRAPPAGPPPVPIAKIEHRSSAIRCPRCRGWQPRLLITDGGDLLCSACLAGWGAGGSKVAQAGGNL